MIGHSVSSAVTPPDTGRRRTSRTPAPSGCVLSPSRDGSAGPPRPTTSNATPIGVADRRRFVRLDPPVGRAARPGLGQVRGDSHDGGDSGDPFPGGSEALPRWRRFSTTSWYTRRRRMPTTWCRWRGSGGSRVAVICPADDEAEVSWPPTRGGSTSPGVRAATGGGSGPYSVGGRNENLLTVRLLAPTTPYRETLLASAGCQVLSETV